MPLFEVAILEKPTKSDEAVGAVEQLVFGPKALVATNINAAEMAAILEAGAGILKGRTLDFPKLSARMRVLVRPFV